MYVTYEKLMAALGLFTALCIAGGWLIKIIKGVKKPADDINSKVKDHDKKIDKLEKSLDYLVNANNLVIRTLFTVLGELAVNNDKNGNCKKAQNEIQKFLTPVDGQHDVV